MMNELVPVFPGAIANTPVQLVDARRLHSFMEVATRFNDWIRTRIEEYGFVQDQDFLVTENPVTKSGRGGDRRSKSYHVTIGMGKELAMVERNDKGREVRRYFIECERIAHESIAAVKAIESPTITASEQQTLSEIVARRAGECAEIGKAKAEIWSRVHRKFRVAKYNQLPREQLSDAIAYVMQMDIKTPKEDKPTYSAPLSLWQLSNRAGTRGWMTYQEMAKTEAHERPLAMLLRQITEDGHDVAGAQAEYNAIKLLLEVYYWRLATLRDVCLSLDRAGLNVAQH